MSLNGLSPGRERREPQVFMWNNAVQNQPLIPSGVVSWFISAQSLFIEITNKQMIRSAGAVLGGWGGAQGPVCQSVCQYSQSGPPCGLPDKESASIVQWQISCNDFILKGKSEIKCLSSLLPQNCWNCRTATEEVECFFFLFCFF